MGHELGNWLGPTFGVNFEFPRAGPTIPRFDSKIDPSRFVVILMSKRIVLTLWTLYLIAGSARGRSGKALEVILERRHGRL
ncbi:hypothetical protein H5410_000560 [Solanum commersonii]|uniref:Uncharacterized protein n=1 Tax=Solanum commersonii TaxID=4109 RepID=A0A9J6AX98_SOLCO|nr:hypothetical protein H5410_000560 [Solanum commersonii]